MWQHHHTAPASLRWRTYIGGSLVPDLTSGIRGNAAARAGRISLTFQSNGRQTVVAQREKGLA